jgi:hypothetical protein
MTVEKTNTITFEEVSGIQLECRNCGVRTMIPLGAQGRFPVSCGYCEDPWVINSRTDLYQAFLNSISSFLTAMRNVKEGGNNANFRVSIEIKPELIKETDATKTT